jgi:hypothetical protein
MSFHHLSLALRLAGPAHSGERYGYPSLLQGDAVLHTLDLRTSGINHLACGSTRAYTQRFQTGRFAELHPSLAERSRRAPHPRHPLVPSFAKKCGAAAVDESLRRLVGDLTRLRRRIRLSSSRRTLSFAIQGSSAKRFAASYVCTVR